MLCWYEAADQRRVEWTPLQTRADPDPSLFQRHLSLNSQSKLQPDFCVVKSPLPISACKL